MSAAISASQAAPKFRETQLIQPVRDRLADRPRLCGEIRLARFHFIRLQALERPPIRDFISHPHPLRGAHGIGFLTIGQEAKRPSPAHHLEYGLSDEPAVALAPFRIFLKRRGQCVIKHLVLFEHGFGNAGGGFGEDAVHFHEPAPFPKIGGVANETNL